jgi:hypothetical protein
MKKAIALLLTAVLLCACVSEDFPDENIHNFFQRRAIRISEELADTDENDLVDVFISFHYYVFDSFDEAIAYFANHSVPESRLSSMPYSMWDFNTRLTPAETVKFAGDSDIRDIFLGRKSVSIS